MAKYRTYKNGITGHRYKGYYIIKGETKGKFAIWNEDDEAGFISDPVYETNKSFRNLRAYVYVLDESHVVYGEVMEKKEVYKSTYNAVRCVKNVDE